MFSTTTLSRFAVFTVLSVALGRDATASESHFDFNPRTITVHLYRGRGEFDARLFVTPRIMGTESRPVLVLSVNRLELHRVNPGGLSRVTWEFDLSDCDMRKQFTVKVELTGSNGNHTEEVDWNGNFTYYVGDVISAVNVDYKWLDNEASWQFTHGRRMPDGQEFPYVPPRSGSNPDSPWTQDQQTYAAALRAEARRMRELADEIDAAAADADVEIERLTQERNTVYQRHLDAESAGDAARAAELLQKSRELSAKLIEAVELRRQAEVRVDRLRKQADDTDHDAEQAWPASDAA